MRVLAYCLVPNHFHLALWPAKDGDLSRWMHRLLTTHVRRTSGITVDTSGRAGSRPFPSKRMITSAVPRTLYLIFRSSILPL